MSGFEKQYLEYATLAEGALEAALPLPDADWPEHGIPKHLAQAMRYSLLGGGKRLRPVLLLAAYHVLHDDLTEALPFCAAIEMIHAYSLIHDDLPAMDDDDLRRGKPTSHRMFGEATAVLAGDALLNLAFETMAQSVHPGAMRALREIAHAAGAAGMIAGQVADMQSEGKQPDTGMVRYIHQHKTADLLTAAVTAGLALGGADEALMDAGRQYGRALGLAFQITDDLLDVAGNPDDLGKSVGKDAREGKITWPAAMGVEQSNRDVLVFAQQAAGAAGSFGCMEGFFASLAHSVPKRIK